MPLGAFTRSPESLVMTLRPELTQAAVPLIEEVEVVDEQGRVRAAYLPGERPLTVYLDKRELVTLMTLGGAPEHLVLGYLRNQRLVESIEDIAAVQVDWETESAAVTTRTGVDRIEERTARRVVTTGCGQGTVFGSLLDEVDSIRLPVGAMLDQDTLYGIIDTIRLQQSVYKQAGSVHGCALFQGTELLMFVEDVGRHNAVDAIAGRMWLEGMTGGDKIFYTTGRLTSEMVIKGAQMGIPFLLSRSGVTQMGYQMARRVNLTLFARCTGKHFLLYTGRERFRHRQPEDVVA
ncbi:Formate dehydrogenase accessory protein [Cupriavidus taiwanensis]|uniref:Sulfur carrier protein FdhD n=2 Tax=Cupriavidus taiwanensis TaxID=164546 RepID=A0A976AWE9_9BURK|nr:Formate dehydrogenase accessory protein [Cupriavidus taiwanensis]SOZ25309.1 Formate dehydrogenase accessory protein [Cupriavidus taiwanensis]SOZ44560.1 Formate dehydrogenase accessory protein [Cupriavidus taiwanensis]SOZ55477.1 Formate dehydrogenase accessory protein [Cupriavidus taiwanensis]SOZ56953.1 Formate dehydrogenase accessory protein [Cupriavidus taiwanensis]